MQQSECALEKLIQGAIERKKYKQNTYVDLHQIQKTNIAKAIPEVVSISHLMFNTFSDYDLSLFNANLLELNYTSKYMSDGLVMGSVKDRMLSLPSHLSEYALADAMLHVASSNYVALTDTSIITCGFSYRVNTDEVGITYGYGLNELFINYLLSDKMAINNHQGHTVTPLFNKLDQLLGGTMVALFFAGNPLILKNELTVLFGNAKVEYLYQQLDDLYVAISHKNSIRVDTIVTNLERIVDYLNRQTIKTRQLVM